MWWGKVNIPFCEKSYLVNRERAVDYLNLQVNRVSQQGLLGRDRFCTNDSGTPGSPQRSPRVEGTRKTTGTSAFFVEVGVAWLGQAPHLYFTSNRSEHT